MVAGVDLNHRPLGYEANPKNDSIIFQRLDDAGNDRKSLNRKSLKRPQSRVIGPQSDHDFLLLIAVLQFCKSRLLRAVSLRLKVLDVYATSIRIGRPRAARIISFAQPAQHL